jgi:hypothetical protein
MKIAIYGDSYGSKSGWHQQLGINPTPFWVDLLKTKNYDITNYSLGGTNLYFSYLKFLESYREYDKVIFLVTNFGRLWVPQCETMPHISHFGSAEYWYKHAKTDKDKHILLTLRNYFLHIQDLDFEKTIHYLLVEKIRSLRGNLLLVPCFPGSLPGKSTNSLFDACCKDWENFRLDERLYDDLRHAHMNELNNYIFAKEIDRYLKTEKFDINNCTWVKDTRYPLEFYFRKR